MILRHHLLSLPIHQKHAIASFLVVQSAKPKNDAHFTDVLYMYVIEITWWRLG